jgi:hypothetical protein
MATADQIAEIGIDVGGSLYVKPRNERFLYIYREAMEVHWDVHNRRLYSPKPRDWSYFRWYRQILAAAKEQGTVLEITAETVWTDIPEPLRIEIESGT